MMATLPRPSKNPPTRPQQSGSDPAHLPIDHEQEQLNEIEALGSIYVGCFEDLGVKRVWNKITERKFKLTLTPSSDEDSTVVLEARLPAKYPTEPPHLEAHGLQSHNPRTQARIREIIEHRPKQLQGQVAIYEIAEEILVALEDAVKVRQEGVLASLQDERVANVSAAAETARKVEKDEARQREAHLEKEAGLLIEQAEEKMAQVQNKKTAMVDTSVARELTSNQTPLVFDRIAKWSVEGEMIEFDRVHALSRLSSKRLCNGQKESVFVAQPVLGKATTKPTDKSPVALRRFRVHNERKAIQQLEVALDAAQRLPYKHEILRVLTFRLDNGNPKSDLLICTDFADLGTLQQLLQLATPHFTRVRKFTIDLLNAVSHLHEHGFVHGKIDTETIFVASQPSMALKLGGIGYSSLYKNPEAPSALPSKWQPPGSGSCPSRKADVWMLGVVVCQMLFGLNVATQDHSPRSLLNKRSLWPAFEEILSTFFGDGGTEQIPAAGNLMSTLLMRIDAIIEDSPSITASGSQTSTRARASSGTKTPPHTSSRLNSATAQDNPSSWYRETFEDCGILGKGGFGQVRKAQSRVNTQTVAVKIIKQKRNEDLTAMINEVNLLSKLNHQSVVRYIHTHCEKGPVDDGFAKENGSGEESSEELPTREEPDLEDDPFERDNGEENDPGDDPFERDNGEENDPGDDSSARDGGEEDESKPRLMQSDPTQATVYVVMELCESYTLGDMIKKGMPPSTAWRMLRQITEGLAHIHTNGIVHRDLKPPNIFIHNGQPKIGDFGLATIARSPLVNDAAIFSGSSTELSRAMGTPIYMAPELRSTSSSSYDSKVDMYALGIIFYEMCEAYAFKTRMEEQEWFNAIRQFEPKLPTVYNRNGEKAPQGRLILNLVSHNPADRKSSAELLTDDVLMPIPFDNDMVQKTLRAMTDSKSPYHPDVAHAFFSTRLSREHELKAYAWNSQATNNTEDPSVIRLKATARQIMVDIFRRHGAEETRRPIIFPSSTVYTSPPTMVEVIDSSLNRLQLPLDLTLPHARQLARGSFKLRRTFAFGNIYRASDKNPPLTDDVVDFNIMTQTPNGDDESLKDAELIKVLDEVVCKMPPFAAGSTSLIQLNHSEILGAILQYCRVDLAKQSRVTKVLSRLGFENDWPNTKSTLLGECGLSSTAVDDLRQFNWSSPTNEGFQRLKDLLKGADERAQQNLESAIQALRAVRETCLMMKVKNQLHLSPLASAKAEFYAGKMLVQWVRKKSNSRQIIAVGGRYDSLVRDQLHRSEGRNPQGAVGFQIGLSPLISNMTSLIKSQGNSKKASSKEQSVSDALLKRCNVLVVTKGFDPKFGPGVKLLASLWDAEIGAELADAETDWKDYSFAVTLKHEDALTAKVTNIDGVKNELDVPVGSLVEHLIQELREGDSRRSKLLLLERQASSQAEGAKNTVQFLTARRSSKKVNRDQVMASAREQWQRKQDELSTVPILVIEMKEDVLAMEAIQQARVSDDEAWGKLAASVPAKESDYVDQIHEKLKQIREKGSRVACVYNSRSNVAIHYDLAK